MPPLVLKTFEGHSQRSHFALQNCTIHITLLGQDWRITILRIPAAPCFFLPSPFTSGEKSISVLHCMALPTLTIW